MSDSQRAPVGRATYIPQGSDIDIRIGILNPEAPKKGTWNELLRLIKTNFDKGKVIAGFAPLQASTTFGQVFLWWTTGEYLAYMITDVDSSTAFSTA